LKDVVYSSYTSSKKNRPPETMNRDNLEKRVSKRYPPTVYVNIYEADTNKFFGLMADLSKTGFKLSSQNELTTNQPYHLAIRNPFASPKAPLYPFVVKAQWCRQREDGVYETGFEFIELEKESDDLFVRLNEDFQAAANLINRMDD
jgi:hypothetical protein